MPINPFLPPEERFVEEEETQPLRTYRLDFTRKRLHTRKVDGIDALRQFIRKAIITPRFRHLIYNDEYGCELKDYIGYDVTNDFLDIEISRMIREAIIGHEHIQNVINVNIQYKKNNVYIEFTIITELEEEIREGVVI